MAWPCGDCCYLLDDIHHSLKCGFVLYAAIIFATKITRWNMEEIEISILCSLGMPELGICQPHQTLNPHSFYSHIENYIYIKFTFANRFLSIAGGYEKLNEDSLYQISLCLLKVLGSKWWNINRKNLYFKSSDNYVGSVWGLEWKLCHKFLMSSLLQYVRIVCQSSKLISEKDLLKKFTLKFRCGYRLI